MFFPRYSLRMLLALMLGSSLFFLVAALAVRGASWAVAVVGGLLIVALALLMQGAAFFGVWLFGRVARRLAERRTFCLALMALGCGLAPLTVQAAGSRHPPLSGHGLSVVVDTRWAAGAGYRPVFIEITPVLPANAPPNAPPPPERELVVELHPSAVGGNAEPVVVRQILSIGATPVETTLLAPQFGMWHGYTFKVFEGGLELPALTMTMAGAQYSRGEPLISVLMVRANPNVEPWEQFANVKTPTNVSRIVVQGVDRLRGDLPTRWLEYTAFDLVVLTRDDLRSLAQEPGPRDALFAWVRSGGNLCVTEAGVAWDGLPEIERLLGLEAPAQRPVDPVQRGWKEPVPLDSQPLPAAVNNNFPGAPFVMEDSQLAIEVDRLLEPAQAEPVQGEIREMVRRIDEMVRGDATLNEACNALGIPVETYRRWKSELNARPVSSGPLSLAWRTFGLGAVVVRAAAWDPQVDTGVVQNTLGIGFDRLNWGERHGLSPTGHTRNYWDFLIPGVGLAPVGAFQIFITLFVLVIGPLNYWLLSRARRLQFLIVTVPICAGAIALSLFLYALVTDGFSVRTRVRSVTQLDQRAGQAACCTRLSYYAGLAPRAGLSFAADTAVYPVFPEMMFSDEGRQHRVWDWADRNPASGFDQPQAVQLATDQQLSAGWLNPRTPMQLLTVRSRPSQRGLDLAPAADGGLSVTNRLEAHIRLLVVCTADNQYYRLTDLPAGAVGVAAAEAQQPAQLQLRMLYLNEAPLPPPFDPMQAGYRRRRNYPVYSPMWGSTPAIDAGMLERPMKLVAAADAQPLTPGTYVAVTSSSPEVDHGLPSVVEEASFHMVIGRW